MKKLTAAIKAMADEPRLSILIILALRGAVCVSHLQEAMKTPQPTVSRYLAILRNAGLLEAERKGQWVYYRLNEEEEGIALEIVKKYAEQLKDTAKIRRIMDRLDKIEQQPSLTNEIEQVEPKRKVKTSTRQRRSKKADDYDMSLAPIPIEPAEIVESRLEVQDLPKDVPSDEYTSSVEHERDSRDDTSVKIAEEAARMDQTEADGADSSGKQTAVGNKKGRKEKKPQPPSLFDF